MEMRVAQKENKRKGGELIYTILGPVIGKIELCLCCLCPWDQVYTVVGDVA